MSEMEPPEISYARSGDVAIAYQVVGDGPIDLVFIPQNLSIAVTWDQPIVARFYERLTSFSRLILLDKRGTGISDRPRTLPTLETQMDDVRAVLDAVGSEQAALFGTAHGAQMCALFAATYPERSFALILWNAAARLAGTPDEHRAWLRMVRDMWGTEEWVDRLIESNYPSFLGDEEFRRWFAKAIRINASPGSALEFLRTFAEADITDVLPAIQAPTLVAYRRDIRVEKSVFLRELAGEARRLADAIPHARLVAIPGGDAGPFVGPEVADEVERFLAAPEPPPASDRVLATVLFTDIVGSTAKVAELGDRGWRQLVQKHHETVRSELGRFRGKEMDTASDGFFATFDGPARAIQCACAVRDGLIELGLQVRAGLHAGECELLEDKVGGIAVHIGARVAALADPGEVLVSSTVKDLVAGSGMAFEDRGQHELTGILGEWHLFAVR